jgi:hypothetical protein
MSHITTESALDVDSHYYSEYMSYERLNLAHIRLYCTYSSTVHTLYSSFVVKFHPQRGSHKETTSMRAPMNAFIMQSTIQ